MNNNQYYDLIIVITILKNALVNKVQEPFIKDLNNHIAPTLNKLLQEYEGLQIREKISVETIDHFVKKNKAHFLVDYCLAKISKISKYTKLPNWEKTKVLFKEAKEIRDESK